MNRFPALLLIGLAPVLCVAADPPTTPKVEAPKTTAPETMKAEAPAATPEQMPDVPEIAQWEINRRGFMVQELGTTRATPVDAIADALAPPEDDSHKWFFSVVTMDGCPACDRLKADIIRSPVFRSWVNVDDPSKSTFHYQVRRIEDETQRDWFRNIKPRLDRGGFPAIVIQPPKNGEYGPNKTVVCIIHGYDGDAEKLTNKLRDNIVAYVEALKKRGELAHVGENAIRKPRNGGIQQTPTEQNPSGGPPPFVVPDKRIDPFQPQGPVNDWPPVGPKVLTLDEVKALCPGATPDFLLEQLAKKATDPNVVRLEWEVFKAKNPTPTTPAPETPSTPSAPIPWLTVLTLVAAGNIPGLIALGLTWYRSNRIASGKKPYLDSGEFQALLGLTDGLDNKDLEAVLAIIKKRLGKTPEPAKA